MLYALYYRSLLLYRHTAHGPVHYLILLFDYNIITILAYSMIFYHKT